MSDESDRADEAAAAADNNIEVTREIIAFIKEHAEELREKGLPVDKMIADLEEVIANVIAAREKLRDIRAEDDLITRKRTELRRQIDEIARLPADLVDGQATVEYLSGIVEKRERRKGRRKKDVGS